VNVSAKLDQNAMNELYQKFEPSRRNTKPACWAQHPYLQRSCIERDSRQRQEYAAAEAERRKTSHQAKVRLIRRNSRTKLPA